MTMYTHLQVKVVLKPAFVEVIDDLIEECFGWEELYELHPHYEFLYTYSQKYRSSFIPDGVMMGGPDSWESYRNLDKETREWTFMCSLNNIENTMQHFFDLVLSEIAEKVVYLESLYEADKVSKVYAMINNRVKEVDGAGKQYKEG